MRFVTFERDGGRSYGVLVDDAVVDLRRVDPGLPETLLDLLQGGAAARERAQAASRSADAQARLSLDAVHLLAPIPHPDKILCVGLNYRDHAAESNIAPPDYPTIFAKYSNTVIGPRDPIVLPSVTNQVDYEGELGVVIGRRVRGASEADALSYVAGYLVFNDVSARDYQGRTSQWTIGKSFDTFAPM
ncbi:MAG TPA: fumarylacetoacetate hydrolase family protein, partial [Chloroflexota bacterium]|nr:fumarylacetoacetate hydrolase family protein [Chloroflexota bacterium]